MSTYLSPLERAARAAYTRPDGSIPWERRSPARRAYWRTVTRRALDAALNLGELAQVLAEHRGDTRAQAVAIRTALLSPVPLVKVLPDDAPGRAYGEGYDGHPLDEATTRDAQRAAQAAPDTDDDEETSR